MGYCSSSDVAALCKNLTAGGSDFGSSTSPTQAQVNAWISTGCSLIDATLAGNGYGSIPATSVAYGLAQQVNACYAAWMAERSRSNPRIGPDENNRADQLNKDYKQLLADLTGIDLSRMGVAQVSTAYAGGISVSDKAAIESDSNRVAPRFIRGSGRNIEALDPGPTSAGDPQSRGT